MQRNATPENALDPRCDTCARPGLRFTVRHMSTSLTVGKARIFNPTALNPDGSVNTAATITATSLNTSTLRVVMNPANNREGAIVGLAQSAGVNAKLEVDTGEGTKSATELVIIGPAAPGGGQSAVSFGTFGPEVTPPSWAQ